MKVSAVQMQSVAAPVAAATAPKRRTRRRRTTSNDNQKFLVRLQALPEVRRDVVRRIRNELHQGTYVTQEKLDAALDLLLREL